LLEDHRARLARGARRIEIRAAQPHAPAVEYGDAPRIDPCPAV
jgi:hypothetical protein